MSKELRTIRTLKLNIASTATTLNATINYKMKNKELQKEQKKILSAHLLTLCTAYLKLTRNETCNLTTTGTLSGYLTNTLPKEAADYFNKKLNLI